MPVVRRREEEEAGRAIGGSNSYILTQLVSYSFTWVKISLNLEIYGTEKLLVCNSNFTFLCSFTCNILTLILKNLVVIEFPVYTLFLKAPTA
jgi:hypothetical protein